MNKSILDVSVEFIFELVLVSLCFRSDSSVSMFMCLRVFAGRFDVLSIFIGVLVFALNSGCNFFLTADDGTLCDLQKAKGMSKKMKKVAAFEKRMQEKEFERAFFREFWPDNV